MCARRQQFSKRRQLKASERKAATTLGILVRGRACLSSRWVQCHESMVKWVFFLCTQLSAPDLGYQGKYVCILTLALSRLQLS